MEDLEKLDLIRERIDVSYQQARAALKASEGDVVAALIWLEREQHRQKQAAKRSSLIKRAKKIIKKGNNTKIRLKQGERVLLDIPMTVAVVGGVLAPKLVLAGVVASAVSRAKLEIEKNQDESTSSH